MKRQPSAWEKIIANETTNKQLISTYLTSGSTTKPQLSRQYGTGTKTEILINGKKQKAYIYGIGRSSANQILEKAGVDKDVKVKDWTDDMAAAVREVIGAEFKVEGDLRSEVQLNIKRLMDIGCYRGVRHRIGLPVRGQSTKNNARTRKGRKKTVANKKKATK